MLETIRNFIESARVFVLGQPVLFVLVSALIAAVWSVTSESVTYWVARLGGRALVARMSRWLRVNVQHLDRTEAMFLRWGIRMVLFGRIFPGVRTLVSVPAGLMRMDFGLYLGVSFGGAMVWNTLLVGASYLLGSKLTLLVISILLALK